MSTVLSAIGSFLVLPGALVMLAAICFGVYFLIREIKFARTLNDAEDVEDEGPPEPVRSDDDPEHARMIRFDVHDGTDAPDMKTVIAVRVGMTTTGGMAAEVRRHKGYCPGLLAAALHATAHYLEATHGQSHD